ncbi:MAG: DUF4159 domain-containing protein [Bryobacteraceae bacterium]|nr:DUF4159 domain-containing protein [Bryobacteraceae bacterium]
MLRPAGLLPSLSRAFDTPLGSVGSLLPAGVCYRALRRLPGRDFHPREQHVLQDAPCGLPYQPQSHLDSTWQVVLVLDAAERRVDRVHVRPVEQPVNPDDGDDIFHWPYLHVGMPSTWNLTDAQAQRIREYLLRGGFLLCDSFFGTEEWAGFMDGMKRIFPDRTILEIPDEDPIFGTVYTIKERYQVGNFRSLLRDSTKPYRADGSVAYWRAIRDDKGRIMVAMAFNSDLGDSWQLADEPRYPEKYSALGLRIGVNYVVYALTH